MTKLMLLAAVSLPLMAAAPSNATLGPPVTGSMYNGNNVHPPNLQDSGQEAQMQRTTESGQSNDTTGAQVHGGHGAAQGGGG